jgi:hypothetical protein
MSEVRANSGPGPIKNRNFKSHEKHFGATILTGLPEMGLNRSRQEPIDQQDTEFCTAFGEAVSQGYEQGVPMSGEWQTAKESEFVGYPILAGADPVPSMMATSINGSLPRAFAPYSLQGRTPEYIANWQNWSVALDKLARDYMPGVPFYVDGPYDVFDNVRNALWKSYKANEKGVVKAFGFWYDSWNKQAMTPAAKGVVELPTDEPISRHRYNFIDWTTSNGKLYLVAALTQGTTYGDKGFLYMDRGTVNKVFANSVMNGLGLYINRSKVSNSTQFAQWLRAIGYYLLARVKSLKI